MRTAGARLHLPPAGPQPAPLHPEARAPLGRAGPLSPWATSPPSLLWGLCCLAPDQPRGSLSPKP